MLDRPQMLGAFSPQLAPYKPMVGFEYEVQCFDRASLSPLTYGGDRGLLALLTRGAELMDGELVRTPGDPVSAVVLPDGGGLSLEPGGQFEFSSAPEETFGGAMAQFRRFLGLLDTLCDELDLHVFYGGANPVHTPEEIGLQTRKRRYQIMNDYYPRIGPMGRRMMRQTCSIQVSFDYPDRRRGEDLLRTAMLLAPLAAALFSNSPFIDGGRHPYRSYRVPIWQQSDPTRSGLLPGFTRPDYGFDDYLDHVLRAPMFFVQTPEGPVDARGLTFDQFNRDGYQGQQATMDDFLTHNSTIFTDVRLKHTVEVRSVDGQDPALLPGVLALLCGILFCERSRHRVRQLLGGFAAETYRALPDRLAREGMDATVEGRPVPELLETLLDMAAGGLPVCFPDGADAVGHLDPVRDLLRQRKTPADLVLERFGDAPHAWLAAGRTFPRTRWWPCL